jgi:hypothetical protein
MVRDSSDRPAEGVPAITENKPDVYYFKDSDGKLLAVPDITLEELTRLLDLDRGLKGPDEPSKYSIKQLVVRGTAAEDRAKIQVQLVVHVRPGNFVGVPLFFEDFVSQAPARFQGPGVHELDYHHEDGGYIAWIGGPANSEHTVTLEGVVPLISSAGETKLRLRVPGAVSSELELEVPVHEARANLREGAGLVSANPLDNGNTRLNVQGLRGNIELNWLPAANSPLATPKVMEVRGQILVKIKGPDEFQSEARLRLRSFGPPIQSFRVRLPPGHELQRQDSSDYTLNTLDHPSAEQQSSRIVEVKFHEPTDRPDVVLLNTLLTQPQGSPDAPADVAGFEVLDALRQSGEIALSVEGDWSLYWSEGPQVRRVGELTDPPWPDELDASFQYFRQPFSLAVSVRPMKTRVRVQPTYILSVDPQQVRLEAVLKYTLQGAPASFLAVDMTGWEVQSVQSGGRLRDDALDFDTVSPLVVTLGDVKPGEFAVQLQARKRLTSSTATISIGLPHPVATSLMPAAVVVIPAKNVQLTPRSEQMPYLAPTTTIPEIGSAQRQVDALYYRDRGDQGQSRFVCDIAIRPGVITVDASGQARIGPATAKVRQTLDYEIQYEPADVLGLYVHPQLLGRTDWGLSLDGQRLDAEFLRQSASSDEHEERELIMVRLPEPRDGKCRLEVDYELTLPALDEERGTAVMVPLVMPAQNQSGVTTKLHSNQLVVEPSGVTVSVPSESPWTSVDGPMIRAAGSQLVLTSPSRADQLTLIASRLPAPEPTSTLLERAVLQTWLMPAARQERALFRLWTSEDHVQLTLPRGVQHDAVEVMLDGQPLLAKETADGELTLSLPGQKPGHYLVELIYPFTSRPPTGPFVVEFPTIRGVPWVRSAFWQLITPADEHLVAGPRGMSSHETWSWGGRFWRHQPLEVQRDLERWIGASARPKPSSDANQYLFSTFGPIPPLEVRTASRRFLVAACSGFIFVVGMAFIHVPLLRGPVPLLGGTIVLVSMSFVFPTLALIVIQAGGLGLALVVIAWLLLGIIGRKHLDRPLITGRSVSSSDMRSTGLIGALSEGNSTASSIRRQSSSLITAPQAKP